MSRPVRVTVRHLGVAAAALVAALGAWVAGARLRAPRVLRFDYWAAPLDEEGYRALAARDGWSARPFDLGGGLVARGLERAARDASAPWIVFFPGNSGTVLEDSQKYLDALVGDRGWGAVVWAYRGFDGSGGAPKPELLVDDAWRQYQLVVQERGGSPAQVHVIGFSLGSAIASAVEARAADHPPASVVLLAPLTVVDVSGDSYETLRYLDAFRGPTLVLHGGSDDTLPVSGAREVANRLGTHAHLVVLPGLRHFDLLASKAAVDVVRSFTEGHGDDLEAPAAVR
ncbi:MAG TPA: hypothetical protein VKU41_00060 [Polyangiaceae bacterium]|nr:hypothetical protein [Polyangiaceae bacterium]